MDGVRNIRIVAAVIQIGSDVLLVHQQGPTDPEPAWALPGGRVEPGESLIEALTREVAEETGFTLDAARSTLLYVCEVFDPHDAMHAVTFVFRATVMSDRAPIADPDGFVHEARFVPLDEAAALLSAHPYLPMCEGPAACLRGDRPTFWSYRVSPLGIVERVLPE
jgi:ADP-ribose pyrophosphatase YjhB (NUDIX family)